MTLTSSLIYQRQIRKFRPDDFQTRQKKSFNRNVLLEGFLCLERTSTDLHRPGADSAALDFARSHRHSTDPPRTSFRHSCRCTSCLNPTGADGDARSLAMLVSFGSKLKWSKKKLLIDGRNFDSALLTFLLDDVRKRNLLVRILRVAALCFLLDLHGSNDVLSE